MGDRAFSPPTQAVIPWGFAREDAAGLARALTDAARFGFTRLLVPVPLDHAGRAHAIIAALPPLPHLARIAVHALDRLSGLSALPLDRRFLLVDPGRVIQANWLDLFATPAQAIVAGTDGAAPAGLAGLDRDLLPALSGADAPRDVLARLGTVSGVGRLRLPADAVCDSRPATPARPERPALFLDRDGTLNEDYGYVSDPARLVLLPGAAQAVKRANDLGWNVFLVTNQSGIGRGYYAEADAIACNAALQEMLRAHGAHLDDIRYAADHPEAEEPRYRIATGWRKPEPGMLIDLMAHWPTVREMSLMVGDKDSDIAAGAAAGVRGLLFTGGDLDALVAPHLTGAPCSG